MAKQNQYYIFKFDTIKLKQLDYKIDNYTASKARLNGELISLGYNQVIDMIHKYYKIPDNNDLIKNLYVQRDDIKKLPSSPENIENIKKIQKQIEGMLFVSDIINIKVKDKNIYKTIFKNGFDVNGKHYVRFAMGAGQSRRNTCTFINQEIYDFMMSKLMCGLNKKIKKISVSKFNCYFALCMSGIQKVSTPRVCIVNDYEIDLLKEKVDWIEDQLNKDGKYIGRKVLEKTEDLKMCFTDGQGIISPTMAEQWKQDLKMDYLPSQFIFRTAFGKGLLAVFDFKDFAEKVAKTEKIKDYQGNIYNVNDIDVLMSLSQWKMHKEYKSWSEYEKYHKECDLIWGVARCSKEVDDEYSLSNYQYSQVLDLNDKGKINELINPTIDWIKKICTGDKLYTLLFLLGVSKEKDNLEDVLNKTGNDFVKAIVYNDKLLQDPYVRKKIYESIESKITAAKISRLWVRGNYQFMVSDLYLQCEYIFEIKNPKGLLGRNDYYCDFWNRKGVSKVLVCRSPLVDFSELNVINLVKNGNIKYWFKYQNTGLIYNGFNTDTIRHSDSDFDGDIVFSTDNKMMVENSFKNKNVITYKKETAPLKSLAKGNIFKTDIASFDSQVGRITNFSTIMISMLPMFQDFTYKVNEKKYNELIDRIKLLRRFIGDSIDVQKGIRMKPFPKEWKSKDYKKEGDSEEIQIAKSFRNSLVANKKPYFMIYIYEGLYKLYKSYRKNQNLVCKEIFNMNFNNLQYKKDKTDEERKFIKNYYYHSPVLLTDSLMNRLCKAVETVDFDIKFKDYKNIDITVINDLIPILKDNSIEHNEDTFNKVLNLYKKYIRKNNIKPLNDKITNFLSDEDDSYDIEIDDDSKENFYDILYTEIRNEAYEICSNAKELANYGVDICYKLYPDKPKDFVWNICREGLMDNIYKNKSKKIEVPCHDKEGIEYLGKNYKLMEVVNGSI